MRTLTAAILAAVASSTQKRTDAMPRQATYSENIGLEILHARQAGTPWKVLMLEYRLCRTRLYQLMKVAEAQLQKEGADPEPTARLR